MAKETYAIFAVKIGATVIDQITDQDIDPGLQNELLAGDGNIDNEFVAIGKQEPRLKFTTTNIKAGLDKVGVGGLAFNAANPNIVELWFRRRDGSGFAGAGSHIKVTVNEGFIFPVTAQGGVDGVANIQYEIVPIYDGTNDPVVLESGMSFSHLSTPADMWVGGPAYLNGTLLDLVQSTTINFGISVNVVSGSGQIWPEHVSVTSREPSIELGILDLSQLSVLDIGGKARTASTRAFFRKKVSGGGLEQDATAVHIQFDVGVGKIDLGNIAGSGRDNATTSIAITPVGVGGGSPVAPIVVSTAIAVSGA